MDLRRHELVRLTAAGWRRAAAQHNGADAAACFAHWAVSDLPAVVATQACVSGHWVSLGVPAPTTWGRQRYALRIDPDDIRRDLDAFPEPAQCGFTLGRELPGIRVHGSFGWERLTGLPYVHHGSDIDLTVPVADAAEADTAVGILEQGVPGRRVDGELAFPNGPAVAWREWQAWRAGRACSILVRRARGACIERDLSWLSSACAKAAA